jgi:hypothetical protein
MLMFSAKKDPLSHQWILFVNRLASPTGFESRPGAGRERTRWKRIPLILLYFLSGKSRLWEPKAVKRAVSFLPQKTIMGMFQC